MSVLFTAAAATAAGIHVLIFALESLWFRRSAVRRRFGVRDDLPESTRLFAFNQGFYNLFLALGVFAGLGGMAAGYRTVGMVLVLWNTATMLAAALVLLASAPRLWRGALIQGGPAALTLAAATLL